MRGFLPVLVVLALASCTAAGGNGGGGGGGGGGVVGVGYGCTPGYADVCAFVNGLPAILHCDAKSYTWVAAQMCSAGGSCNQAAGGVACFDAASSGGSDASTTQDTSTSEPEDTYTPPPSNAYQWVIIDGSKNPDCSTNSPGPDIDAVALYRNIGGQWYLMGMGKGSTPIVKAPANPKCNEDYNDHDTPYSAVGPVNGVVSAAGKDTDYFGLGDRSLYLQIGACTDGTQDLGKCDGAGPVQEIKLGDQLAVWEVDQTYKTPCKYDGNDAPECGKAYSGCYCKAEQYGVGVATTSDATAFLDLGTQTGTNMFIDVKK